MDGASRKRSEQLTDVLRPEDLVFEWRLEADRMEIRGLRDSVRLMRSMADQLEAVLGHQHSEILTLGEAARESGYSADHLGRMIREGTIPNAGRPRAPRIRRSDVPRKASELTKTGPLSTLRLTKAAIVRSIADQER